MRQPLLDAVRGLDPALDPPQVDGEAMLARIHAQATGGSGADVAHLVPPRRSPPARRLAMGAAALTAITAVALVLTLVQRGPQAYASWVAEPAPAPVEAAEMCPDVETGPPEVPVEPEIVEQRGSYTFAVLSGDGVFVECLVSTAGEELFMMAQGTEPSDPAAFELGEAPAIVLDLGSSWEVEDAGEGPITTVIGLAAPEVTGVRVSTVDGVEAEASLSDGWWSVWFPGEVEISDDLVLVTSDGESTLSLEGLIAPGVD